MPGKEWPVNAMMTLSLLIANSFLLPIIAMGRRQCNNPTMQPHQCHIATFWKHNNANATFWKLQAFLESRGEEEGKYILVHYKSTTFNMIIPKLSFDHAKKQRRP